MANHFDLSTTMTSAVAAATPTPQSIFILAGQSNMGGRGGIANNKWDGIVPPEAQPDPSIFRLNPANQWEPAHEPIQDGIDIPGPIGVGPGMAFANGVRTLGGTDIGIIGLIPCAKGGTKIDEWVKGSDLYNRMVSKAQLASAGGGKIKVVLWYQGESDTDNLEDAQSYKGKLKKFISDVRADLKDANLPFILVAIASGEAKYIEIVRQAQLGIQLPNVKTVDAKGLPLNADNVHLTTDAEVQLGLKLAHAFLGLPQSHSPKMHKTK